MPLSSGPSALPARLPARLGESLRDPVRWAARLQLVKTVAAAVIAL